MTPHQLKKQFNADRLATEQAIKSLKELIRNTPRELKYFWSDSTGYGIKTVQQPHGTQSDWEELHRLKAKATALYEARAAARGKTHRKKI